MTSWDTAIIQGQTEMNVEIVIWKSNKPNNTQIALLCIYLVHIIIKSKMNQICKMPTYIHSLPLHNMLVYSPSGWKITII